MTNCPIFLSPFRCFTYLELLQLLQHQMLVQAEDRVSQPPGSVLWVPGSISHTSHALPEATCNSSIWELWSCIYCKNPWNRWYAQDQQEKKKGNYMYSFFTQIGSFLQNLSKMSPNLVFHMVKSWGPKNQLVKISQRLNHPFDGLDVWHLNDPLLNLHLDLSDDEQIHANPVGPIRWS